MCMSSCRARPCARSSLKTPSQSQLRAQRGSSRNHPKVEARRSELADKLAIGAVEKVAPGTLLELGTVAAAMTEVAERVGVPEATTLIEPTIAVAWARDGIEPAAPNEEDEAFIKKVRTSSHLHMIVHSESPRHYTYVHVELQDEAVHKVDFKDSLPAPAPIAARQVEKILRNLRVASPDWQCPRGQTEVTRRVVGSVASGPRGTSSRLSEKHASRAGSPQWASASRRRGSTSSSSS